CGDMPVCPADERPEPSEQLFHLERLGEVVIGPGIDTLDFLGPATAGGEDQDRHGASGGSPSLENRDPVETGQAQVEDDGVVGLGVAEEVSFLAIGRTIDRVAGPCQGFGQLPAQARIVLDDQDPHQSWRGRRAASTPRPLARSSRASRASYSSFTMAPPGASSLTL